MKRLIGCMVVMGICAGAGAQQSPLDKANRAFLNRDFTGAMQLYQLVLDSPFPLVDAPFALFQFGECYRLLGNWEMASRAYWKLSVDHPDSEWTDNAYLILANHANLEINEEVYQAIVLYETIVSQYPDSDSTPAALLGLATARSRMHYFESAEKALNQLLENHPDHMLAADACFELAQILANPQNPRKNTELALKYYLRVLEKYPGHSQIPTVLFSLGNLYWKQQNCKEAIRYFRLVTNRFPTSFLAPLAQTNIGLCHTDLKDYAGAVSAYQTLLERYSQPPSVHDNIQKLIEHLQSQSRDRLQISAWNARINKKDQRAVYEGDVQLTFGKSVIIADRATVNLEDNSAELEGNVRLKWGVNLVVFARKMTCRFMEKSVQATGDVLLQRRFGNTMHEERWQVLALSLSDGSSTGITPNK